MLLHNKLQTLSIKWKLMLPIAIILTGIGFANSSWVGFKVHELSMDQSERDMINLSETVFGVMTDYMNTGMMHEHKKPFLDHMNKMLSVRMIWGAVLDKQYGSKAREDYPQDQYEEAVFRTKEPVFTIDTVKGEEHLRGIFPYINVTNYMGSSCIPCHSDGANKGDVLGALSISISMKKTQDAVAKTRHIIALITVLLSLSSIGILFLAVRSALLTPLQGVLRFVEMTANKDFRSRLEIRFHDDIGRLSVSINQMAEGLGKAIRGIAHVTDELSANANHLKEAMNDTVSGTDHQAQQVSLIATAAEEMSQTVQGISHSSTIASTSAHEAMNVAIQGKEVLRQSVVKTNLAGEATKELSTMIEKLNSRVLEISDIISVISEIADQTNLLALNAAIEAARAGEQGRGFAVVADEVRRLAAKTMKATQEISNTIKAVQTDSGQTGKSMKAALGHVTDSVAFMTTAHESLDKIVNSVQKTADEITQIATSIEQQTLTSEDIAKNIEDISQIASRTQASTGKLRMIFEGLNNLSQHLKSTVDEFKL
jgi:methyl-accepting chemotaxis protein